MQVEEERRLETGPISKLGTIWTNLDPFGPFKAPWSKPKAHFTGVPKKKNIGESVTKNDQFYFPDLQICNSIVENKAKMTCVTTIL